MQSFFVLKAPVAAVFRINGSVWGYHPVRDRVRFRAPAVLHQPGAVAGGRRLRGPLRVSDPVSGSIRCVHLVGKVFPPSAGTSAALFPGTHRGSFFRVIRHREDSSVTVQCTACGLSARL